MRADELFNPYHELYLKKKYIVCILVSDGMSEHRNIKIIIPVKLCLNYSNTWSSIDIENNKTISDKCKRHVDLFYFI